MDPNEELKDPEAEARAQKGVAELVGAVTEELDKEEKTKLEILQKEEQTLREAKDACNRVLEQEERKAERDKETKKRYLQRRKRFRRAVKDIEKQIKEVKRKIKEEQGLQNGDEPTVIDAPKGKPRRRRRTKNEAELAFLEGKLKRGKHLDEQYKIIEDGKKKLQEQNEIRNRREKEQQERINKRNRLAALAVVPKEDQPKLRRRPWVDVVAVKRKQERTNGLGK
jgi:hypothetical protein